MTDEHQERGMSGEKLPTAQDKRPRFGGWAPGEYVCNCLICACTFWGDKRASTCADCAYSRIHHPMTTDESAERAAQIRIQALGAALSRRDWGATERAYEAIRDSFDKARTQAALRAAEQPKCDFCGGCPRNPPCPKCRAEQPAPEKRETITAKELAEHLRNGGTAMPAKPSPADAGSGEDELIREGKKMVNCLVFAIDDESVLADVKARVMTLIDAITCLTSELSAAREQIAEWWPVEFAPEGVWLRTRREGEDGENICAKRTPPREEPEWIEQPPHGRTTVIHSTFAAPTHWRPVETKLIRRLGGRDARSST